MSLEQDDARADPKEFWTRFIQPRVTQIQGVLHHDGPEVIEAARRTIDAEVAAMRVAISSLLTRRNTLSPISNLPAEVLGLILHFVAVNEPPPEWQPTHPLGWIRTTHVCRFWRETALQLPGLWSEITDRLGDRWTDEMLARAKSAPISYSQFSYKTDTKPGNVVSRRVIPCQISRLRHLSIRDRTDTMDLIMASVVDSPAPILESPNLQLEGKNELRPLVLPEMFANDSPMLRRLELSRIQVPWSAPILRGIHHLKMEFPWSHPVPDNPSVAGYYNQFFDALKEMQDLRTLHLAHCFPCKPRRVVDKYGVNLPRLESLSLRSEDTEEIVHILKRMTVPQSCRISLFCEDFMPPFWTDIRDLAEAHMATSADFPSPLTMFLSITDDDSPVYILDFWRSARTPRPVDICTEPDFSLRIPRQESGFILNDLKLLKDALWMESIRTLIVHDNDISWEAKQWIRIFRQNDALENVRASARLAMTFCDAMRKSVNQALEDEDQDQEWEDEDDEESSDEGDEGEHEDGEHDEDEKENDDDDDETEESEDEENTLTKENVFLKNLKFVELEAQDFDEEHYDEDDDSEDCFQEHLKAWLSSRREAMSTLPTLGIKNCYVDPAQIEELKEITKVDWDLKERIEFPLGGRG